MGRNNKPEKKKTKKPNTGYMKKRPRRPCFFCENKIALIDYKDLGILNKFLTDRGKILPIKQSYCCAKHQRELAAAIKVSREIGLLPYTLN